MSKHRASSAIARPARTAIQATPAVAIAAFIDAFLYDMTDVQFGAAVGALTVVIGWAQTLAENVAGRGLLRDVPDSTDPVPGD